VVGFIPSSKVVTETKAAFFLLHISKLALITATSPQSQVGTTEQLHMA